MIFSENVANNFVSTGIHVDTKQERILAVSVMQLIT
jgi:hypothetical protein